MWGINSMSKGWLIAKLVWTYFKVSGLNSRSVETFCNGWRTFRTSYIKIRPLGFDFSVILYFQFSQIKKKHLCNHVPLAGLHIYKTLRANKTLTSLSICLLAFICTYRMSTLQKDKEIKQPFFVYLDHSVQVLTNGFPCFLSNTGDMSCTQKASLSFEYFCKGWILYL